MTDRQSVLLKDGIGVALLTVTERAALDQLMREGLAAVTDDAFIPRVHINMDSLAGLVAYFDALPENLNCSISYHPRHGMKWAGWISNRQYADTTLEGVMRQIKIAIAAIPSDDAVARTFGIEVVA